MRQSGFFVYCRAMLCVILGFGLSGCISVPDSPNPRFYTLQVIDEQEAAQKFKINPDAIIGVGPVKIPEYLRRPQIVTRDKNNMLTFAQFDRWGESLDLALARLVREDLRVMLSGAALQMYPWNVDIPVKYQVLIDVLQLESDLDKDLFFAAQWSILDPDKKKMLVIKRSEFRQPVNPNDYSGVAKALSAACASLSSEIAKELSSLEQK